MDFINSNGFSLLQSRLYENSRAIKVGNQTKVSLCDLAHPPHNTAYMNKVVDLKLGARPEASASTPATLDAVLKTMSEGVIAVDSAGRITAINPAAERLTAWPREQALGMAAERVFRLEADAGNPDSRHPLGECLRTQCEMQASQPVFLLPQGSEASRQRHTVRWRALPQAGGGAVLLFEDITRLTLISQELYYRAHHDPLTGLLNREEFEQRLRAALADAKANGRRYRLCFVDLDRFRLVNETAGPFAGDEMLRDLAAMLRSRLRETDQLARLGADEFGVLLLDGARTEPSSKPSVLNRGTDGLRVEDAIREAVKAFRFQWDERSYTVTASIGVSSINAGTESIARVMADADAACRAAKDAGRDRVRHANTDLARRHGEINLMGRFTDALNQNRFVLFAEDVVELNPPGRVVYRELLVRWRDDNGRLIMPSAFIQTAERYFLITALDRWVVSTALKHLAARPDDGVVHAVNLSGQSLVDEEFLSYVLAQLRNSGVAPARLCFEVTETAAISRLSEAVHFLRQLSDVGVRFSLDDFGTGMASFSYLRSLPVQFLKIDGSFVHAMLDNQVDRGMVEAINRIGHEMGLRTIAESVETPALIESLRAIGVDLAQGHAISKGRPLDEI